MILELHDCLGAPQRIQASRILIKDDFGQPFAVLLSIGPRHVRLASALEPGFEELLDQLGVTRTHIITRVDTRELKAPRET